MNQIRRGGFIAFEGGDGAGKTTQLTLLESWFRERSLPYERTREPGGTPIGERIRSLVLEHGQGEVDPRTEALLFAASRAAHVVQRIEPALEAGRFVLCDRYVDSSVAYQGVGRQLGAEAVAEVNAFATGGLQPDLTVVLDIEPAAARARREGRDGDSDRIESAEDAFHERLRAAFLARAEADPQRYLVLQAADAPESIQAEIRVRVQELLSP
ncbi:dTMP kinase [Nesterenkonia halotolerans]|uniref:Thymidylate kinase n=1 Tax=Nesterenkonia halotolerans TaxID=225325 RepID=A0ABR9J9D9_9MICC|nr:dTMP kinase [Nesterenkonia halotolerans]MBE1515615.1 dTMP kinase [Nesterenkonia halotolerans]